MWRVQPSQVWPEVLLCRLLHLFLFFSYVLSMDFSLEIQASSCLSLSSTAIIGEGHHDQLTLLLSFGLKAKVY